MVGKKPGQLRRGRGGLKVYIICGTFLERGDVSRTEPGVEAQ